MLNDLIFWLYATIGVRALIFAMRILAKFNSKIAEGLKMRSPQNGIDPWLNLPARTRPIWIHCASGEFEYAKPVIKRLKAQFDVPILVTYFSPSIKKAVESFSAVDMSCVLPWDRVQDWQNFLTHHDPRVLLIARTDTWPQMLRQTHLKRIPSLLFSATLVAKSGRAKPLSRLFSKIVFANLDAIYCVSFEDHQMFVQLGCGGKAVVAGDTRYDQVIERLQNPKVISPLINSQNTPVLVAGSTWPEDERIIIPALSGVTGKLRTILVPHEPNLDHVKDLEIMCDKNGLSVERLSKLTTYWNSDILVVDQLGILAELYQIGNFAFVGGSFKKTVHSVMEPLAAGCPTLVGPLHTNNREAIAFQGLETPSGLPAVIVCSDTEDFGQKLLLLCELDGSKLKATKQFIQSEILNRSRKSEIVVAWVNEQLN